MTASDDNLWYKDAVIYQTHVKAFFDSNNDGMGDFPGLTDKLDYLQDLGVSAIWILPFYPSPLRDDGYDISDYRDVNPSYGTVRDFRRFVREAHRRNFKVITELVINHTSDQHPWFQRARRAKPGSNARDFYVWSDTDKAYSGTRIIFTDTETSNWAWDPVANAYYWHRFFSHQPDLNFDNPRVVEAVLDVMRFWMDMGVDGMRLDAIPYLVEREGTNNENLPETHDVIRHIRATLEREYPNGMLLGEANQWPEDVRPYFGDGDECHMAFHFPLMPRIYMAVAQEDRHPITDIMRQTPEIPANCQWAVFLRNHDELTLEMVTDRERDYLWNFYAADMRARVNVGIRRRLAPLLNNDRRKIELLNSLLMSMPGTPIVYYGDEIGMGDNIFLGDRNGVRTPMQWSPDRNGGFSKADPARLYLPAIMDPVYGYDAVNVEAQERSPSSLLNWMKHLINVRKLHKSFGRGVLRFLYPGNRKVLAYLREHEEESILCVANLSRAPQPVVLDLATFKGRVPVELLGRAPFPPVGELPYFITLPAYGFYWFLLAREAEAPTWHEPYVTPLPELLTLVLPNGWQGLMSGQPKRMLEEQILPEFAPKQRWFGAKDQALRSMALESHALIPGPEREWFLGLYRATLANGEAQDYFLPLSVALETRTEDPLTTLLPFTLARVRRGPRTGIVYDAMSDPGFVRALLSRMQENQSAPASNGEIRFWSTNRMKDVSWADAEIHRLGKEQSNTSVAIGETMILKAFRRLGHGTHPEVEIGRFLTEVADYRNTPPLYGAVELCDNQRTPTALLVLQGFVRNQGDGWTYSVEYLQRALGDLELLPAEQQSEGLTTRFEGYSALVRTLGVRTAELHRAFAIQSGDPAFDPEPITKQDVARWRDSALRQAEETRQALDAFAGDLPEEITQQRRDLLAGWDQVTDRVRALLPDRVEATKTRHHGDYHLGQVLVAQNDWYLLDFEGEPLRSVEERRAKVSPLRDVAGMLRSFDYAAWSGVFEQSALRPERQSLYVPWALAWRDESQRHFLDGYREAIGDSSSYPADAELAQRLIDFFTLEKALYEVRYEAQNRPAWLRIPLQGVLRLLSSAT